jgi:fumarate hydratase class II
MKYRIESDTLGAVKIPEKALWGPQTQRSINNFKIGEPNSMPIEIIRAYSILKKSCAKANHELNILDNKKMKLISDVCDEINNGIHDNEFPLVIWQTGSGTQTNMNVNEVISNRSNIILNKSLLDDKFLKANDHVNMSQSSNDTFPTAINIAVTKLITEKTIISIEKFIKTLNSKVEEFNNDIKIGRTHLMDATPLTLGQEFSGYESQIIHGLKSLKNTLPHLKELAIGGTAVGTGLNAPLNFDKIVVKNISHQTNIDFEPAENKFESIASNDALVESHGALKQIAVSLFKIANDIRLMGSGPRSGFAELILPSNEPGSSIMPGKVNPTQCEALSMVCTQIMGNDTTVTIAGSQGHLELNVFKPVLAHKLIESAHLIADACESFNENCLKGLKANKEKIKEHVDNSLMLVTALNKKIGYYKAAEIANNAYKNGTTLRHESIKSGYVSEKEFDECIKPENMI